MVPNEMELIRSVFEGKVQGGMQRTVSESTTSQVAGDFVDNVSAGRSTNDLIVPFLEGGDVAWRERMSVSSKKKMVALDKK